MAWSCLLMTGTKPRPARDVNREKPRIHLLNRGMNRSLATMSKAHECGKILCCCPPLVAAGNPPAYGPGAGHVFRPVVLGGLERCAHRLNETDHSGRRPRFREQARLRPQGAVHHLAHRRMEQSAARRYCRVLFTEGWPAAG